MRRLKTRQEFQCVLAGQTIARTQHFALHRVGQESAREPQVQSAAEQCLELTMGAMVPKRWARRAVTRNTIKRQIYVVGERFKSGLTPLAHLVRLRASFDRTSYPSASSEALKSAVRTELHSLFERAMGRAETGVCS